MFTNPPAAEVRTILTEAKTIAVVGISEREDRASRYVAEYLLREGYTIYPVNPNLDEWHGQKAYDTVMDIPAKVDIVDVFRRPEYVMPVAENAVKAGAKVLWLQQGIINDEAADLAAAAGITVLMDTCIMVEHKAMKLGL
ncbi:MAG: CoA-binding protein [Dehalococcoidia bacterium]|jgi:hypothetical protein|nr:CoA-binding protein [Dehalococcoidia bacterium]